MKTIKTNSATFTLKNITYGVYDSLIRVMHAGINPGEAVPIENLLNTKQKAIETLIDSIQIGDNKYAFEDLESLQEKGELSFMEVSEVGDKIVTMFTDEALKKN